MPSHSYDVLVRLRPQMPQGMVERATEWTEDSVPSPPVPAASVILLRDSDNGLETYLLHRHALMPFAASMVVFPGGRVDPVDREDPVDRVGPVDRVDPVDADRLDPIRRCAIRETTEETGVVLADTDLHPWARWMTPEFEPRRYDTWFFVAIMPTGQNAADISGETERAEWSTPQAALVAERSGVIKMLPPTMSILIELADCPTVADVIDHVHERQIEPVLPGIVKVPDGWRFRYPTAPASERSS